ncbi:response regulator transcription factor [Paenibacillus apis]|uniref:DNA-binding response regulator n=1 Tax=Paenibacillus apis TaxID=1792174 RepID=A0A920CJL1_9BACL|nr:response regulator [Paenibacillus apis]GIO42896.1 hypothetical protein J41TS4_26540 [Paenibacillus apis]
MRALIVDDEARVRKAVQLLVDWDKHGIREVREANGGNEAIEIIKQFRPQLVIMDMMMGSGHGLELMAWVYEHASNTKFIVVSGHDDFDFVRSAVRHGGVDYILKPIDPEAINTAVRKAVDGWRLEEAERADQQLLNIRLNEFKPLYDEKLLSSLIDDPGSAEGALGKLRKEGLIPTGLEEACLLIARIDPGDSLLQQKFGHNGELLLFAFINICNEFLLAHRQGIAFKHLGGPQEIVLLVWSSDRNIAELIEQINQGLFVTLQRRLHFGAGSAGPLPHSLPKQYTEAGLALRRRNLLRPDEYMHRAEIQHQSNSAFGRHSLGKLQEEWKLAVQSADDDRITLAASKWFDEQLRLGVITPELLTAWKNEVMAFRARTIQDVLGHQADSLLADSEYENEDTGDTDAPLPENYTFSKYAWIDWTVGVLAGLSRLFSRHLTRDKDTISEIVHYIEQNYQSNIALQDIAAQFYVSREYVSRKFKQTFGINFSDYLAKYRIDKAKLLMSNPHLKLQDVAELVGFRDVKYFSKVFKKQEGLSPREYKESRAIMQ